LSQPGLSGLPGSAIPLCLLRRQWPAELVPSASFANISRGRAALPSTVPPGVVGQRRPSPSFRSACCVVSGRQSHPCPNSLAHPCSSLSSSRRGGLLPLRPLRLVQLPCDLQLGPAGTCIGTRYQLLVLRLRRLADACCRFRRRFWQPARIPLARQGLNGSNSSGSFC
jgi:hypothetical protein